MSIISFVKTLRDGLRAFGSARGGNITVTFAMASLPIVGFVGAAVDYSHANSARTAMQMALDSTALMLSKDAATLNQTQLNTKATAYFNGLFTRSDVSGATVTPAYTTTNGSAVTVTGTGTVNTNFMGVMGIKKMTINGTSTVKWGQNRLRVALVLDNTGSMDEDGKMEALIPATISLLTQLKTAAVNNGDVYVSIVPFVKDVNVGKSNYQANWIDWTDWNNNNGNCSNYSGWSEPQTKSACQSKSGNWSTANHNTWNGCVMDRGNSTAPNSSNYDQNVTAPTTSITATLYAAEQYNSCPAAGVMALNYNWTSMTTLVNSMTSNGNTNQGIGLQLGWMSLVGGGPFPTPPAQDPNYQYSKVIILMTDGLNTQNRWYSNQDDIDDRQAQTCANIKAAGITLYTIQVNTGGDPTQTVLKNCASDSSKFFLLTKSNQIVTTFTQIGTALSQLRISK